MILSQIKEKLEFWKELLEKQKTAAEKVVFADLHSVGQFLGALDAKVSIVETDALKEIRPIVAAAKGDTHTLVTKIDAAVAVSDKAAADLRAAVSARPAPAPTPAPVPITPEATPAEPVKAPVVDVTGTVTTP